MCNLIVQSMCTTIVQLSQSITHSLPSDRLRNDVCRTLNAFINTGRGGTVYLGIADDGRVQGLQLTKHQV